MMELKGPDILNEERINVDLHNEVFTLYRHITDQDGVGDFVSWRCQKWLYDEALKKNATPEAVFDYIRSRCYTLHHLETEPYCYEFHMTEFRFAVPGLTQETLDKIALFYEAKRLINRFYENMYGEDAGFGSVWEIELARTTTKDKKHEIRACANLMQHRTEIYLDNELVRTVESPDLEEYVAWDLYELDYDELTYIPEEILKRKGDAA